MTYLSTNTTMPSWTSAVVKWFLFRLGIYVAVAAISAGLFFVGAAVYVHFVPPQTKPTTDPLPSSISFPKPYKQYIPSPSSTDALVASLSQGSNVILSELYKQNVYDQHGTPIGLINDAVVDPEGKITSLILSIVSDAKEKNIAVPFDVLKIRRENGSPHVVVNDKNLWAAALGVRYDRAAGQWLLDPKSQMKIQLKND